MENNDSDSNNKTEDVDLQDQEIDNSDESSGDEQDEMETEQKNEQSLDTKLAQLEETINQNKFQYQIYIEIINLVKEQGELNKLREYREKMSQVFPLTETLWLEWLKDEQKFMDSENDRLKIDHLFQRAVQDYLSVELWLEYIQFSIGGMGEENGIENVRSICEKAISFAGLHVTRGYSLWEVYREFETALLAGYQQASAGSIQTPEQTKQINDQISRINRIFKLQLGTCLDNMESTFEELKQFDETVASDSQVKNIFDLSKKKYHDLEPYEAALLEAASEPNKKMEKYYSYLDFELRQVKEMQLKLFGNKNIKMVHSVNDREKEIELLKSSQKRTKCLFERALADDSNCLNVDLWLKYSFYLIEEENQELSDKRENILSTFKRAVRNCPWSAKLWINYALESEKSANNQVKEIYGEAMQAGLQSSDDYLELWHAYLAHLRRTLLFNYENESDESKEKIAEEIRDTFQKAINQLFDYFKLNGDPKFSLERFWAKVEAKYFRSMDRSRKIYNEMILAKSDIGQVTSEIWLDFYQLETQYGDEKHQRKLLHRALNELKYDHDKQAICDLLINFEQLSGNIGQFSSVYYKNEALKIKLQSEYVNQQHNLETKREQRQKPKQKPKKDQEQVNKQDTAKGVKRKKSENEQEAQTKQIKDKDGFAIPSLPGTELKKQKIEPTAPVEYKKVDRNCTVFLSNLKYDVDESKVKEIFQKEPGFLNLRLIKHWSGKTKGYGYVDFEKPEQAEKALRLDRSLVDDRPVFVSKNEDKDSDISAIQNKFKFATNMEKNKLFVSGLPFSSDKQALEDVFKTFGKVKDIRIVTFKSGKSKGLAYVEFEDEQSASKALIQTDGMLIGENQISVAISNPPKRKQPQEGRQPESEVKKSLGSGTVESRTSSNTTSFVPRSQQLLVRKKTLNLK